MNMFGSIQISAPIFHTIKTYQKVFLRRDIVAGLTVAAVAIPQAMAYAQLAGVNLTAGLYAAMVAMLAFAVISASRYVIMGPDAAMAALAGSAVLPLAAGDQNKAIALVAVLSIFIGIASVGAVFARVSFLADFLSRPILLGYMAGLAVVVIASQLPKLFGISAPPSSNILGVLGTVLGNVSDINWYTFFIAVCTLFIGFVFTKWFKKFPVSLLLLVVGTFISWLFAFSTYDVAVVGILPSGLPVPNIPAISPVDLQNLVIPAIAMMLIAYANTIATARTFAQKKRTRVNPDQELMGLGVSNIASGIWGGLPVSGSGVRTAVNYQAGAKTQIAQIFAAVTIGLVLVLFSSSLQYLPLAVLGVIIIIAVLPLFNYKELKSIWYAWRSEAVLAVITMIGVAILGVYQGLLLALFLAILNIIRKSAFPNDAVLGLTASGSVRDMHRPPKTHEIPGLKIYRFDAPLYFGNANQFRRRVLQLIRESDATVKWFLWDAETITGFDSTSGQMLLELIKELKARNITFAISRMKGSIRTIVHHTDQLDRALQRSPHFVSMGEAIAAFEQSQKISEQKQDKYKDDSLDKSVVSSKKIMSKSVK